MLIRKWRTAVVNKSRGVTSDSVTALCNDQCRICCIPFVIMSLTDGPLTLQLLPQLDRQCVRGLGILYSHKRQRAIRTYKYFSPYLPCDKWVPVTTAWRVLRLRMEERPPIWRVAANKLNKQSGTADKGWSSSLRVGRGVNNASPWKPMLRNTHKARCFLWRQNNPAGTCEYGNELSGSIKCGEFLD